MAIYSTIRINKLLEQSNNASNPDLKGAKLEELAGYLMGKLRGLKLYAQNLYNPSGSRELDLVFTNDRRVSDLHFLDSFIPIECKNTKSSTSSGDLIIFANKVRDTSARTGVLISISGVSGANENKQAKSEIKRALSNFGVSILVIDLKEILSLRNTDQLAEMLKHKYYSLCIEEKVLLDFV